MKCCLLEIYSYLLEVEPHLNEYRKIIFEERTTEILCQYIDLKNSKYDIKVK